jgi:predicted phage terminase large subunit-like protein
MTNRPPRSLSVAETEIGACGISPAQLARILLKRRRVRRSFLEWCRHCGFKPATHHRLLIDRLERLARGEIKRLAVFMPPGSGKSTYASTLFSPYVMANAPRSAIIAASHTTELAERFGRKSRNLIAEHSATLGLRILADNYAAGRWELESRGEYYAAGVGSAIVGFRADGVVIDDPIRSREDADSQLIRDKIWDWYKSDLLTRLRPGGWIVLIQTRWHEDDLAGRILADMERGGEPWEIISLPAEAEVGDPLGRQPGEWLWDYDDEYAYGANLRREKATQLPRNWSALYQQRPAPETGDYFKDDWLRSYAHAPPVGTLNIYGASDYAVTSRGGDYTVHICVGVDPQNRMYLLDLWRGQTSPDLWIEAWCDLVQRWKPSFWAEEQGQIVSSVGPFLERRALERQAYTYREQFPSRHDKAVRAQSIRGRMALRGLYVRAGAPWFADLRAELLSFPAGKHDDQVDALGLIGQLLDKITGGQQPRLPNRKEREGYGPAYNQTADDSFKTL